MKNIKFIIVLFAAILFTIPMYAQHDEAHRGHRGHGMKHLIEELNLSDTQQEQAKELRKTYHTKMEALREQEGDRSAKREQMHQLREEQETALRKILTTEQIAILDTKKAERKAKKEAFKNKMKSVDKEAMRDEMKAYKDENIKPVLLEQRKKLEPSISAADQAEIKTLRTTLKAARKEMKAMKEEGKADRDKYEKGKGHGGKRHGKWKAVKEKYEPQYKAAQALVDKYDTQINALLLEIQDEKAQWDEDIHGIKEKYFGDIMEEFGKHPRGEKPHKRKGERGEHNRKRGHDKADKDKIAFLLMDVEKAEKKTERKAKKAKAIKVFPNPSTTDNTIQYTVSEAGNVKIELHDRAGNVVKEITNEYKTSGNYTETVNLNGLNGRIYFYVITDQSGVRSKKFVIK